MDTTRIEHLLRALEEADPADAADIADAVAAALGEGLDSAAGEEAAN
jgi:hypothetical protein